MRKDPTVHQVSKVKTIKFLLLRYYPQLINRCFLGYRRHSEQPSDIKMFNNNTQMYGNSGPVGAGTRYNTNQHDEQEEEPQCKWH